MFGRTAIPQHQLHGPSRRNEKDGRLDARVRDRHVERQVVHRRHHAGGAVVRGIMRRGPDAAAGDAAQQRPMAHSEGLRRDGQRDLLMAACSAPAGAPPPPRSQRR